MSSESHVRTLRLEWNLQSVPWARKELVEDLRESGISDEIIDESEIVLSELATNAIIHGKPLPDGTARVHWKVRAPRVEIEVSDAISEKTPVPKPRAEWVDSGRGLRIVRALAHEWGVIDDEGSRTVWASLGGPSRRRA